jgi:hypothetical protein
MRELSTLFGADRRTIARWQVFWQEHFPQTRFWKVEGVHQALKTAAASDQRPRLKRTQIQGVVVQRLPRFRIGRQQNLKTAIEQEPPPPDPSTRGRRPRPQLPTPDR